MQTVIAMIALAHSVAAANIPDKPKWQPGYNEGRAWAMQNGKPLAVFIGKGVTGWEKVSVEGFNAKAYQVLQEKYACVYIDTATPAGEALAKEFAVNEKGLVISDKSGKYQAFHHSGNLSQELLVKALVRYSDDSKTFVATESAAHLNPPKTAYSDCPSCQGTIRYSSSYGNCPNGNCPK